MTTEKTPATTQLDRDFQLQLGKLTGGIAPSAYTTAWTEWASHFMLSPGKQLEIQQDAWKAATDTWMFATRAMLGQPVSPNEGLEKPDPRFGADAWSQFPFNVYARVYQQTASLSRAAVKNVAGVSKSNADLVDFSIRQALDVASPANHLVSNPELLALTKAENGQNLLRGYNNLLDDLQRTINDGAPAGTETFEVGQNLAVTPGKVVYRNELIELIQYDPSTPDVYAEPVLFVPAWIMKYYILDLSQKNSMVRYLVSQGHTVFMISWKNPTATDRDLDMDSYVKYGLRDALDAVAAIVPERKIHAASYCIGGTLLAIGLARLAAEGETRVATATMFAAQTDFSEPGELALFINPGQLAMLEAGMHKDGVFDSKKMGAAFMMLRSQDLIWQPAINNYIKGNRDAMIDLMAWNADGTRMPWKMHTEYLYRLYLDNELANDQYPLDGKPVHLSDLHWPMFVVGTETNHVAPWKSVYKVDKLVKSEELTFLLTSGGHNAGIICGPVHPKRHYRLRTRRPGDAQLTPDAWLSTTPVNAGAWWPAWAQWLAEHSSERVAPPSMGAPTKGYAVIEDAPGSYVRVR
jgi:polyhydroxyalkanoate synthase